MSLLLYQRLFWAARCHGANYFASLRPQFNHNLVRKLQSGTLAGLSSERQSHGRTPRNRCVNPRSSSPPVRHISSRRGSGEKPQTLEDIVRLIQNKECRRMVVMAGAGISTPSGIPDFRSPGSGLYDNLQQYDIPYPEAIFEINYFSHNPKPFFALAKGLHAGHHRPNYIHYFVRLLHQKGLLLRMYTQNIDGLERKAGIPAEKLVEAHGTFATATCTVCLKTYSWEDLRAEVMESKVPHCTSCSGVIKPDITFFGEQLPSKFHLSLADLPFADLLLILGTSLEVEPFASLSEMVRNSVPRLLINQDLVGSFTQHPLRNQDVAELGDIVGGVKRLSELLGWNREVNDLLNREHEKLQIKEKDEGSNTQ